MTVANDGDVTCPECGHVNPPKSAYCWSCRYDFEPNVRPKAAIPPPYSRTPAESKPARERGSVTVFAFELLASTIIVGTSWFILSSIYPSINLIMFAAGWTVAVLLVVFSEGRLPDPETDLTKYRSWNPFEFEDDRNRFVLGWHITLFLPRIVLRTIRSGYAVLASPQ